MNLPRLAPLFAGLLVLGLTSCPETNVPRDFGVTPAVLKPEAWEGDWSEVGAPEDQGHFTIKHADHGLLSITTHDKDGKENVFEAVVSQASPDKGSKLFFVTWFEKPSDTLGSVNLMSKGDDAVFYIWHPKHDAVAKAVADGRLKGMVTKDKDSAHSALAADAANYGTLIQPEFWDWTSPTAYFKRSSQPPK